MRSFQSGSPRRPALRTAALLAVLAALLASACRVGQASLAPLPPLGAAPDVVEPPRLYEGFGGYHRRVTTASPATQRWFDQGMQLLYGFNHDEAIRSFREAAREDPDCAMAWWGIAYANGLHINDPRMSREQSRAAYEAVQQARHRRAGATAVERALIDAVAVRYAWPPPEDRRPLDEAYAEAMEAAWHVHRWDVDVGTLYAEALMNLQPWDLWTKDGEPKGRTLEIVRTLEEVLILDPSHPGANHFYIHAVEASPDPGRALAAADRLLHLVPGSGHLVHMPSHIYVRVGRYAEASDANERAIAADQAYFAQAPPPRFYNLYYIHSLHMLAYAAMMEGRAELALDTARRLEREVPQDFLREHVAIADGLMATPLHVLVRFGRWEAVLGEPSPPAWRLLSRAQRRYARSVALSALSRTEEARKELEDFDAIAELVPDDWVMGNNSAGEVLALARRIAAGELAFREGDHEAAFEALRAAAELEDGLVYDEPPGWMQPARHALGALLMSAGRFEEAEEVYREDLERNPRNGWSLLGLEQALRARDAHDEAGEVAETRARAWRRADVEPTSSCYCEPADASPAASR